MIGPEGRARADAAIAAKVVEHPAYLDADEVFTYLSVGEEVDTREIIRDAWSRGKTVAVPRCVEGTNLMEWYRIDDFECPVLAPTSRLSQSFPATRSTTRATVLGTVAVITTCSCRHSVALPWACAVASNGARSR